MSCYAGTRPFEPLFDIPAKPRRGNLRAWLLLIKPLVDPETNWEPMNEEYDKFFPKKKPARAYWGTTGFRRKGQLLQIDCIASAE